MLNDFSIKLFYMDVLSCKIWISTNLALYVSCCAHHNFQVKVFVVADNAIDYSSCPLVCA